MTTKLIRGIRRHPKTGRLEFRRVIPEKYRSIIGKWEFKKALGTSDMGEVALPVARALAEYDALIQSAERKLSLDQPKEVRKPRPKNSLSADFHASVWRLATLYGPDQALYNEDFLSRLAEIESEWTARNRLKESAKRIGIPDSEVATFIASALGQPRDHVHSSASEPIAPKNSSNSLNLLDACDEYITAERKDEKTARETRNSAIEFLEAIGMSDIAVDEIEYGHVETYRNLLFEKPAHPKSEFKSLPLPELIATYQALEKETKTPYPRIKVGTLRRLMGSLNTAMNSAGHPH